jgi:cyclophilin family peptidyl-prolyl cis-trans isomerase
LVDKPGRRKKKKAPWGKIAAVVIGALVIGAIGYYVYDTYIYSPSPVYAKIGTSMGSIYLELFPACAPKTVANFENLTNSGFYNDLVWHRIIAGFVIQTGDPNTRGAVNSTRATWGEGKSNRQVPFEWCGWLHNYAGYVAMASTAAKGPSTSQFYVNLVNSTTNLNLDDNYTVFAKVISGMGVVCSISKVPVYGGSATQSGTSITNQPITPVYLANVTMISSAQAPAPQPVQQCKY